MSDSLKVEQNIEKKNTKTPVLDTEIQNGLKWVETESVATEVSKDIQKFSHKVETEKYEQLPLETYQEIVKGTPLEQKIVNTFSHPDFAHYPELKDKTPEQRAEYLFRKINVALSRFYARKLGIDIADPVPEYLQKVIVPATERFLMDMLRWGQANNVNFLGSMSNFNLQSLSQIFEWVKSFAEKFTVPYGQAKKLMLISDFLALPQQRVFLQKLNNPYDFYNKIMKNSIWETPDLDIKTLKFSDFGLVENSIDGGQDQLNQALQIWKETMRASIWSIQMVENNPETLKKLLGVVGKTEEFFVQTENISSGLLDSLDQLWGIDKTLQSFWIDVLGEVKNSKLLWGVLNFVLWLLWFSGWLEGLERAWRRRQVERSLSPIKKDFLKDIMNSYSEQRKTEDLSQQMIERFKLKLSQEDAPKVNIDLEQLTSVLSEKLTNAHQINPQVLLSLPSFWWNQYVEKTKQWEKEVLSVKSDFFSDETRKQTFVNEYMQVVLPKMLGNTDFIHSLESSNDLAFAIFGGVCVEADTLMLGMKAKAIFPGEFFEEKSTDWGQKGKQEKSDLEVQGYKWELVFFDKIPWSEQDKLAFKQKMESISTELNINPNRLMAVIYKETGGKFDPSIVNRSSWATGLIQFMPDTAKDLWTTTEALAKMSAVEQLDYVKKFFEGGTYNSLKDLYLKTFFPAALEHSDEPDYVFETNKLSAATIAKQNPGIAGNDSSITMRDFDTYIAGIVKETIPSEFVSQFA